MKAFDAEFARRAREEVRPWECLRTNEGGGPDCWVEDGTVRTVNAGGASCRRCCGQIRYPRHTPYYNPGASERGARYPER